jgi:uncharacterized protein (DUF58 family)
MATPRNPLMPSRMFSGMTSFLSKIDREAWLRFLLAMAGLSLAFAAAVFSSAASEAGNLIATAVFSSLALFLAGLVGVLTIPFLFRRVAAAHMRDALQYEFTREGMIYLGVVLVIFLAALNTGNNLLFIVLGAMFSSIVVSGIASAAVLRKLELDVAVPQNAFAGRPVSVRVKLTNPRFWIPSFSVKVLTPLDKKKAAGWEWQKSRFIFPKRRQWVQLPDYTLRRKSLPPKPQEILTRPVYFTFVAPRSTAEADVELVFPRRGQYAQEGFSLSTRFPFSFLIKSRKVRLDRELVVYPALMSPDEVLDVLPLITGEFVSFVRGRGSELYRIREHTPQDTARFVDWKATAKTGSLKVREFTREDERRLRVVFDNAEPDQVSPASYERAVSLAATLACHFAGERVELSFAGSEYHAGQDLNSFLRHLALIMPKPNISGWVLESLPVSDDFNVILTARKPGTIPGPLWESSYVIYMQEN